MTSPALRNRYLTDFVATASPARLLVMVYDRLALDLAQAEAALLIGDRSVAAARLLHAQDIILELRATLDLEAWPDGRGLAQLYVFLITELIAANIGADVDRVTACRRIVEPLRDAWKVAATTAVSAAAGETA
jgi:flagellar protein FliS